MHEQRRVRASRVTEAVTEAVTPCAQLGDRPGAAPILSPGPGRDCLRSRRAGGGEAAADPEGGSARLRPAPPSAGRPHHAALSDPAGRWDLARGRAGMVLVVALGLGV